LSSTPRDAISRFFTLNFTAWPSTGGDASPKMNPFHIYVDRSDIKRVPLIKVESDETLENKPMSAKEQNYVFLKGYEKKEI
jgi:hypothetical protein